ncbi:MAG: hypothetical protein PVF54_04105 [Anaerolineae bacterium]|jgi:hypothetical protein
MFPTVEVRWFHRGRIPPEVEAWFRRGAGPVAEHQLREDHYLHLDDTDALGVKLRQARIEIKQRVRPNGMVRFHERVAGLVEGWRKWSFRLAEGGSAISSILRPAKSWIAVEKERTLRTYQLAADGRVVPLLGRELPAEGCKLELTSVRAVGQAWWTLAFEAFGDESALGKRLMLTAQHVFAGEQPPLLHAHDSRSYPAWLGRIACEEKSASWEN